MDVKKTCYLFFDFDGTVTVDCSQTLLPDGTVIKKRILPNEHVQAIRAAHDMGHKIFLCTGRSRGSLFDMRQEYLPAFELPWDGMICGASDMWYEGKQLAISHISREECLSWLDYCRRTDRIFCYNGTETAVRYPLKKIKTEEEWERLLREINEQLISNPLTNLSTIPAADDSDMPRTELSVIHLPTYSDIFAPGCTKGTAIVQYCEMIGAPIEQTVCFGDSANDMEMFKVCNTRVAMKKAPDSLKILADYVAQGSCGVEESLRYLFGI